MSHICFNGKILPGDEPVLLVANRGYRYGDGLFETMKVAKGKILLANYHFERLFSGLALLKFDMPRLFSREKLEQEILHLCRRNDCEKLARVRLSVSRGNGGLYDTDKVLQYCIECWPLNESVNSLNENGLVIDVFPDAAKNCDKYANLKSANFLPYSLAALFAKENKLNDCLVLNTTGSIADSTIANVFVISGETIQTPGLDQGCVNGVMRRHLIAEMQLAGYQVTETAVALADIENADEVFLSNAINGIRWVRAFRNKAFTNSRTVEINNRCLRTIPV